ncbi:ABC transporter [Actinorhabdospora filicis]|uniref:ABC transporter n=1 Tax=Actinorhabdospora filicis TaxID=1785913 RepID=A0A9W6SHB5_9ACTN|nr:ABC transporter ATP-binding protein [Actinorhabdospora filicis]GLZ75857.1 ABC transporter [Actinorhabdospora filicis]
MSGLGVETGALTKSYGDVTALDGVDLSLEPGKIYGLLGRNGSGKSTLMSILAAFQRPDSGTVRVGGHDPYENGDVTSQIALIRESGDIPQASVRRVLGYLATLRPAWDTDYAHHLAERFGLPMRRHAQRLSRGQKAALACVIGLATRCPLTMLDEVTLGLDAPARYLFQEELLADYVEHPRTIVISTHHIAEFGDLFEEVLILDRGRLIVHDTADGLRERGVSVTGPAETVDRFAVGLHVLGEQILGGTKRITLYSHPGQDLERQARVAGLELGSLPLQDLFVHLTTGKDAQ